MHKLAQIPLALHADDLFNHPNVLQLQTHPKIPEISQTWYCAKDVVKLFEQHWYSASRTLKPIPEHHKAELMHHSTGGAQNVWCLSKTGVALLYKHFFECAPQWDCVQLPADAQGGATANANIDPAYPELLSDARSRPSPLTLMLLLDGLTRDAVVHLESFRIKCQGETWKLRRGMKHPSTNDILPLIFKMPDDEQRQVVEYIDWLINEEAA